MIKRAEIGKVFKDTYAVRRTVTMTMQMPRDASSVEVMAVWVGPFWDHVRDVGRAYTGGGPGIGLLSCDKHEPEDGPATFKAVRTVADWVEKPDRLDATTERIVTTLRELDYAVEVSP